MGQIPTDTHFARKVTLFARTLSKPDLQPALPARSVVNYRPGIAGACLARRLGRRGVAKYKYLDSLKRQGQLFGQATGCAFTPSWGVELFAATRRCCYLPAVAARRFITAVSGAPKQHRSRALFSRHWPFTIAFNDQ